MPEIVNHEVVYRGHRAGPSDTSRGVPEPVTKEEAGNISTLDPSYSQRVWNHSPTGFEWGYFGSGPAQLALALLLDVTGDEKLASILHQPFKSQFVALWGRDWCITSTEIAAWVEARKVGLYV